jgi:DNA-binding MarR family transcriptional regulator
MVMIMGDQPHRPVAEVAPKLRPAEQILAQGNSVRAVAQKLGIAEPPYQPWRPQSDPPNKLPHTGPVKEMSKGNPRKPVAPSIQKFSVRRDESWEMFGLFVNAILADLAVTRVQPPSDVPLTISPKLVRALLYLAQHGGRAMTVGELAEGIGISLGWASRVADELVSIGLLDRIRNEHDRRVVQLQLTQSASGICERLWSDREGAIVAALSEVSPEERPVIAQFLRKLATELELHTSKASRS